jgi:spore maturation protein CgeB
MVVLGLSLSSSWGNGHATTYRALLRGLAAQDWRVLFLERDVPWYAAHRDLPEPDFCEFSLYQSLDELRDRFAERVTHADAVVVGSYVPDGIDVIDWTLATARGTVAFYDIDTPVTLAAVVRGDCAYLAPRQMARFDLYLSFTGGPTLDTLASQHGVQRPRALYCAVDEARYLPTDAAPRWDLGYLGTYGADRQPALELLLIEPARRLPQLRFVVAGPQYPAEIEWPGNVERVEHLPPSEHSSFYGAQRFTLNITRADMIAAGWSPSVRLFEAAACGTPIISDRWPGLEELLPDGEAIVIADGADDVERILLRAAPSLAHRLADRARRIVLAEHTGEARARQLTAYLEQATQPAA